MPRDKTEIPFPGPVAFGGRWRWRYSDILNYERAMAGLPPVVIDPANDFWMSNRQVQQRLSVSEMWVWRRNPALARARPGGAVAKRIGATA